MLWTPERQVIVPGRWPGLRVPKRVRLPKLRQIPWQFTVTESALTSGNSDADQSSYTTASIAPGATTLVLFAVLTAQAGGAPTQPTISGYTWINGVQNDSGTPRRRVDLFRSMGTASGTRTIDYGGVSQVGCAWSVAEFAGVDTSGTNGSGAIVQNATNSSNGADVTSLTITLAAFGDVANATYGCFLIGFISEAQTVGAGFSQIHSVSGTAPVMQLLTEWRNDNDTTVDESSTTADNRSGVAVEIKAAAVAATGRQVFFIGKPPIVDRNANDRYVHLVS